MHHIRRGGGKTAQLRRDFDQQSGTGREEQFIADRRFHQVPPTDRHSGSGKRDFEIESLSAFRHDLRRDPEGGSIAAEHCKR